MRGAASLLLLAGLLHAGCAAAAPAAPEPRLDVQVTEELSTGGFDEPSGVPVARTTMRLRYRSRGWSVQADLPWERVAGLRDAGAPAMRGSVQEGAADLRLKVSVPLRAAGPDATGLDLVLRLKGGNGQRVGGVDTGPAGQGLQLALLRPVGEWNVFGHAGWRRGGSLPGLQPSRHAFEGELGLFRRFGGIELGASVDARQRMATAAALKEAVLYASLSDGERRWLLHAGKEIASGTREAWVGVSLRTSF